MGETTRVAARRRSEWGLLLVVVSVILAFVLLRWAARVDTPVYPTIPRSGDGMFLVAGLVSSAPAMVAVVVARSVVRVLAVLAVLAILGFSALAEYVVSNGGVHITF